MGAVLGDDELVVEEGLAEDTDLFEEMPSSRVMAARRSDELIGVLLHVVSWFIRTVYSNLVLLHVDTISACGFS